ncbi:hypothetical protein GCM10025870_04310 [Agromyces marinus]|uniref:Uncharacterized protein n=1 Tax=Agromyces marinus TaxID=1389020 RepID=A0ABN6YBI3_9MICO|nr:hypothetical protein GCM10025870_04310 [Agromyces marinus]
MRPATSCRTRGAFLELGAESHLPVDADDAHEAVFAAERVDESPPAGFGLFGGEDRMPRGQCCSLRSAPAGVLRSYVGLPRSSRRRCRVRTHDRDLHARALIADAFRLRGEPSYEIPAML